LRNKSILFQPILASILNNRLVCAMITGASIIQVGLVSAGLPGWKSPIHELLGIPDPGCGLTRAIAALLRGNWRTSLTFHAFAPLFVIALGLIAISLFLPLQLREKIVDQVRVLEQRTGLTAFLLIGLIIYWLARLLILREAFLALVA